MADRDTRGAGRFAVDAGGSHTRILVAGADGERQVAELGSINRHATGAEADRVLHELFAVIRDLTGPGPALGWLASASVCPENAAAELDRLRGAAARAGLAADMVVSNDVVPLLWGVPALGGIGVVAVCGTGTGFLGADRYGRLARVGGCEYLGSDEGGAVHIGHAGLRAAVRAADGRGPGTRLVDLLTADTGLPVTDLARSLAAEPFPKQRLAGLAPLVCAAWRDGDRVADAIVSDAIGELVAGVRAVRDRLALPARFAVATAGGVLTGTPELHRLLATRLRAELDVTEVPLVEETAGVVLAALDRLACPAGEISLPDGLAGRHAWSLTTEPRASASGRDHVAGTVSGGLR